MQFIDSNNNEISPDQLPRLVVLTGLNGSGKTRGLKQLQEVDPHGTQYIDYRNFSARWDSSTYASSNSYGEIVLRDIINDWKFPRPAGPMALHPLFGVSDNESLVAWIKRNPTSCNFSRIAWIFFEIFPEANDSAFEEHANLLSKFPNRAKSYWSQFENEPVPTAYKDASIRTKLPVHHLSEQDVIQSLDRLQRLNPLQFDLASMVTAYAEKRNKFFYESCINNPGSRPCLEIFRQSNPNPFDHINAILKRLADDETGVFQFVVQSNVPELPSTYEQLKQLPPSIEIKLRDMKRDELREFGELSSGEQTLLALATLIYTHKHIQPMRALYLDEIDASLHPTMIKSMLEILQEQSGDTRIYLATHSPSTVALAPEKSLFFVEEGKAREIDRTEALEGLTQGFLTTEGISSVFRSIRGIDKPFIVISEGKNYEYLEPMFQKVGIAEQCHIHRYKKARSNSKGATEFKVLHQLFCDLIDTLPNGKTFVFLVDCDQCNEIAAWVNKGHRHVKVLALKQIPSNPQERGIENVVPEELLVELEKKLNSEGAKSIYKNPADPSKGINRKDLVAQKFVAELNRIDITTLEHTLCDLIALCTDKKP